MPIRPLLNQRVVRNDKTRDIGAKFTEALDDFVSWFSLWSSSGLLRNSRRIRSRTAVNSFIPCVRYEDMMTNPCGVGRSFFLFSSSFIDMPEEEREKEEEDR